MAAPTTQHPREHKMYGFIFLVGALIQLLLLARSILMTPGHFRQIRGASGLIVVITGILCVYILIGCFALRAHKPETVFVLRLATIIGLVCGCALAILMALLAPRVGLDVLGMTIMPFFIWQLLPYLGITGALAFGRTPLTFPLHTLVFLAMGIGGFWRAKRTDSVKYGIWSTVLIALMTTLFLLSGGFVFLLIFPNVSLSLSNYTRAMALFLAPLLPLLVYALISGTMGAFFSRARSLQKS